MIGKYKRSVFTLFRAKPIETVIPLWETLAGEKPEKIDFQPRANTITEEGAIVLGSLIHASDPIRINWILSPSQEKRRTELFPVLGSLTEINTQFVKLMDHWLSTSTLPEINRIALGSVSVVVESNKEAAYKLLSTLLPHVLIDIQDSTDFLYQINRPTKSSSFKQTS